VDAWFFRSCERDPAHRFPTVAAQVADLAAALDVAHVPPISIDPALVRALPERPGVERRENAVAPARIGE
jgi:hypothetical protein